MRNAAVAHYQSYLAIRAESPTDPLAADAHRRPGTTRLQAEPTNWTVPLIDVAGVRGPEILALTAASSQGLLFHRDLATG